MSAPEISGGQTGADSVLRAPDFQLGPEKPVQPSRAAAKAGASFATNTIIIIFLGTSFGALSTRSELSTAMLFCSYSSTW